MLLKKKHRLRIAIMMRAMDQDSGFYVYVHGLVNALLKLEDDHKYLLFYRTPKHFGKFRSHNKVTEVLLKAPHKILWDQFAVPFAAWKHKADIIFNPKFSVPLLSHCPSVMGLQEHGWFQFPENYEKFNAIYQKIMTPIYVRRASHLFPMVQWVIEENKKHINLPLDKTTVTYPGIQKHLKRVTDTKALEDFRKKHNLPQKFILSITRVDNPGLDKSKKWNPVQNPAATLKSFLLVKNKIPHHLVFAGRRIKDYFLESGFTLKDLENVHFINFIPFDEIQYLYTLTELMVFPGYYESFSFTLVGAMSCGCPAIVSKAGAFPEVAGDSVIYADPFSHEDFADKILKFVNNSSLREEFKKKGILRAAIYSWEETAKRTLEGIYKSLNLITSYLIILTINQCLDLI